MCGGTSPSVALVVRAVEIFDIRIALIEMEVVIAAVIGTHQQAGEHIALSIVSTVLADFSTFLLHLLPYSTINDRLVDIFENDPILTVIFNTFFILIGFRVGLEIEDITAILLQGEDFDDRGAIPFCRELLLALPRPLNTLLKLIGPRGEDTVPFKLSGNLLRPKPIRGHAVYAPHDLGRFIIHNPTLRIVRVLDVTVGRLAHRLTGISLDLVAHTALFADIAGVPLVEQIADRRKFIFSFGGVDIVRNCH